MPKQNRRTALRQGVLLAIGMALGKMDVLKASNGELTVPLDQWHHVTFKLKGKTIVVPVQEVFDALAQERTT